MKQDFQVFLPLKHSISEAGFAEGDTGEVADISLQLEIYLSQRIISERQHAQQLRSPCSIVLHSWSTDDHVQVVPAYGHYSLC